MVAGSSPPLSVQNLSKHFRQGKKEVFEAVKNISFSVEKGECFGLLGPNGAGKSTTINCLTGFYPPTSGQVLIQGADVHREPKKARRYLGVCDQEDTLDTDFNLLDQLVRHAAFYGIPKKVSRERALQLLERFQLLNKKGELIETLSGGMKRRLQVARALMASPQALVLDEPTTGLDPDARRSLWDVLADCRKQGIAVLLSTHYMEEAERLCDRIAILHSGRILDIASPKNLVEKYAGITPIEEEVRPGVFWKRPPNLEDVFLKLTGSTLV